MTSDGTYIESESTGPPSGAPSGFAGTAFVSFGSQIVILIAGLATSIVLSRALGPEGKGQLALILQSAGIAAVALGLGMDAGNTYFVGRRGLSVSHATMDSASAAVVLATIGAPGLYVLLRFGMPSISEVAAVTLAAGCTLLLPALLGGYLGGILVGIAQVRANAVVGVCTTVFVAILTVALSVRGSLDVGLAIVASLAGAVLQVILQTSVLLKRGGLVAARPSISRIRQRAGYSLKAYATSVASLLDRRQDVLLLGILATSRDIGVYSVGVMFAQLLWQVPQAVSPALTSHSLRMTGTSGASLAATACRVSFAMSTCLMLLLGAVLVPFLPMVYGAGFAGARLVYVLLAPGVVAYGVAAVLISYFMANGKPMPRIYMTIAIVNLALNVFLIPLAREFGAAVASTVSYTIGGVLVARAFKQATGLGFRDVLVVRSGDLRLVIQALSRVISRRRRRP